MERKTWTTEDGKRQDVKAKTKEELAVKVAMRLRDIEEGKRNRITKNMLVRDWSKKWLETYVLPSVSPNTYKDYETRLKNHILPVLGRFRLKDVTDVHCQTVLNNMEGYSKDQVEKVRGDMFNMLKKAKKNKLIESNPADDLELPKS